MNDSQTSGYDAQIGLPLDKSYLERGLPAFLQKSLSAMKQSWAVLDAGGVDYHWDLWWCELNADINAAEVDRLISKEQAWYLRRTYLRLENDL